MNAATVLLVIIAALGLVVAVAVRAYLRTEALKPRPLQALADEISASGDGRFGGRTFTALFTRQDRNTPASLRITASIDDTGAGGEGGGAYREAGGGDHLGARPAIILRHERPIDRLGKRLRLNREIQTGDRAFDDRLYVESDSRKADVRRALGEPTFRQAVLDLFDDGVARVELDEAGLAAARVGSTVQDPLDRARFERTAELLASAVAALPLFEAGRAAKRATLAPMGAALGAVFLGCLFLFARGLGFPQLDHSAAGWGFALGFGVWALGVAACTRLVRGRSDALRRLAIVAGSTLVCVPVGTYGGVLWANSALDESAPVEHRTTVVRKWLHGGGRTSNGRAKSSTVGVDVTSWRPDETTMPLTSDTLYMHAQVGSRVMVTSRAGRFGWEWEEGSPRLLDEASGATPR